MKKKHRISKILLFISISCAMFSCVNNDSVFIITGENVSTAEILAVNHLKRDLESVSGKIVSIIDTKKAIPAKGVIFVVGTPASNSTISELVKNKVLILTENFPGNRGGIWARVNLENGRECVVLAGSDVQGTQYAVYDYCQKVLGIDPLEYWTGKLPDPDKTFDPFNFSNKIIAPPAIPILCYFENDVDELANLKTPLLEYDWESYTEMINALVRLKYNAIHLFDMLGRPEFFQREEYSLIRNDYEVRLSYIDSLINYAHDMGMKVEIDLSLGYKIKPMSQDKADCWKNNKEEWINTWKYYFEKTPLRKADIFSFRPRNQVWDWEYKSSCGEDKTEVFNEVYAVLGDLIDNYKPDAIKVATCYADGMEMFNNNFSPPKDWIIAWSDDGWGGFANLPENTRGYDFGTYMHAGFWKNHTVHDPYPEKIDTVMKMMLHHYQANKYLEVNGQQFRPFLINIEAFSAMANKPETFDGELFYKEWAERYFGEKAAVFAIQSMKKLHEAQFGKVSYVQHLSEIKQTIGYLGNISVGRVGNPYVQARYEKVEVNFQHVEKRFELLKLALADAENGLEFINSKNTFYHDYILLPVQLYLDLLTFEITLNKMAFLKKTFEETGDRNKLKEALQLLESARKELKMVYERSLSGDKNSRWNGWYDPVKRRPNNGFPTMEMLDIINADLNSLLNVNE